LGDIEGIPVEPVLEYRQGHIAIGDMVAAGPRTEKHDFPPSIKENDRVDDFPDILVHIGPHSETVVTLGPM